MNKHLFPYEWNLSDGYPAKGINPNGCKVFGTFVCGGGSTMGYKLAGFEHLGGVELDPKVAAVYELNHHPKYMYIEDIREFNKRDDLPEELYNLDILDGSPPCSTFSISGSREKAWGKKKRFAEGQKLQTLDDLVFVYCDTIAKLKPKVCLLENVSGLIRGNAKAYAKQIAQRITEAGYNLQVFLLNAATMGVPQTRERVFFIGLRNDFNLPKLKLQFNEPPIFYGQFEDSNGEFEPVRRCDREAFDKVPAGENFDYFKPNWHFNASKTHPNRVPRTICANGEGAPVYHYKEHRRISSKDMRNIGTFPQDYKTEDVRLQWLVGMSVPPVMTAQISHQIHKQWLSKIKER